MPTRKAILAAATFLSFFSVVPAVEAQNERTLTEAPAQTGPVSITFDRAEAKYAIGEVVGLFIQSTENAYVTVLNVSPNGAVVKLFPNKYQTDALVGAGKRVQVPDPASGAKLQVSGPVGQEQIKVFYSSKPLTIFADLGGSGGGMFRSIDGGMLRAKFCCILMSRIVTSPLSVPKKTTSMPFSRTPASWRIGASGVPAQRALPIPPVKKGKPWLPEHSTVKTTSCRGRALMSASVSFKGLLTSPPMSRDQDLSSIVGRSKCEMLKNLSFGVMKASKSSQTSWV